VTGVVYVSEQIWSRELESFMIALMINKALMFLEILRSHCTYIHLHLLLVLLEKNETALKSEMEGAHHTIDDLQRCIGSLQQQNLNTMNDLSFLERQLWDEKLKSAKLLEKNAEMEDQVL
jgi:hypothetical protein